MALPTLLDIAIANGSDAVAGLIDEAARVHPELTGQSQIAGAMVKAANVGAARTIKGIGYKTLIRTAVPTVSFRNANQGSAPVKSTHENRNVETFILNPRWDCDKAVADRHEDGAQAFIATEADGIMEGAFVTLAKQFYYGTGTGDAKGHPGLIDAVDSALVVDAGGTTADTGSSVWAVKWGPKNALWVWGVDGQLQLSDVDERDAEDSDGNKFTAYHQELLAYPGLQVLNKFSVGRIKKLTADAGKGLTDILVASLLSTFPAGYVPDCLFASRRSIKQLQASRTATTTNGSPAPFPVESHGIPILSTDAILETEALTL